VRIALLTEIPAPYRVPLFNALAEHEGVDLRVFFLARRDPRRSYRVHDEEHRFDETTLGGRELVAGGRWIVLDGSVPRRLRGFRPDVVIVGGWNQPPFLLALAWGRLHGVPVVSWVESTARDARSGAAPLEWTKRRLIGAFAGFLVPGRASAEYLASFGVPAERIGVAPNSVDPAVFRDAVNRARDGREPNERCTFLYTGRLDPEKNVGALVEAMRGLDADLVVVGSGSEERELRERAPQNVCFVGRVDRDELVGYYANADAYVLPSRSEQWGMTLNEAAFAGLPIVATDAAGAAYELVEDGVSGFRVPAGDGAALRQALERVAGDAAFREAAGRRAADLADRLSPGAWAEAVAALAARFSRTR
jgi:glycosyltransferase involved in cell wall biosynthesis